MMKVINGTEVTAKLSGALKDIARMTGFSEKQVTLGEAGAILKTWAGRTKVATAENIEYRARKRALHDLGFTKKSGVGGITINTGTRGPSGLLWVETAGKRGKPWRLAGRMDMQSFGFRPNDYHWKNGTWIDINEAIADSTIKIRQENQRGKQSVGLARQSVVQIADAAGIDLSRIPGGGISPTGVAKARAAIASNGNHYVNGTASQTEEKEAGRFFITLINSLPYHAKTGMDATLAGVIAGRTGLYRRTFQNSAYKGIQSAARSYPWIRAQLAA